MSQTLHIVGWNRTFENADTRKRERLKSFHAPSGLESRGYLALVTRFPQDRAMMAFGVFQALCQLSATLGKSTRGAFRNSDGTPMEISQLAALLRLQECHLSAAIEILVDSRVRWLAWEDSAADLPPVCHLPPGFVQGEVEGEGEEVSNTAARGRQDDDDLEITTRKHEVPKLEAVKAYAKSAPVPISEVCAVAFFDTQEAEGWLTRHGHSIADWRAALRRYASHWNAHEQGRGPAPSRFSSAPEPIKAPGLDWKNSKPPQS